DPRKPLLVATGEVHLRGDLGVAAPQAHLAAGVGEHGGERRAPAPRPEHGGDDALRGGGVVGAERHGADLDGLVPAHRRPSEPGFLRVSNRSAGAWAPRISSSWRVIAAMMRSVASRSVAVSSGRSYRSDRSTGGPACTATCFGGIGLKTFP